MTTGLKYYKILCEIVELITGLHLAQKQGYMYIPCASKCKRIDKKLDIYDKNQFEANYSQWEKSLKHTIIRGYKTALHS